MIEIVVDEAYAFDMLSVLLIKSTKSDGALHDAYVLLREQIRSQIGSSLCDDVLVSQEQQRLIDVNLALFERIDRLKQSGEQPGDARYIDDMNYQRYLAKQALQQRFFPDVKLTEQKIGYAQ